MKPKINKGYVMKTTTDKSLHQDSIQTFTKKELNKGQLAYTCNRPNQSVRPQKSMMRLKSLKPGQLNMAKTTISKQA